MGNHERPRFLATIKIHDLINIPLMSGTCLIKWHVKDTQRADCRGRTEKAEIKDHRCVWTYEETCTVKMTIDKNGMLSDCILCCEVISEISSGRFSDRTDLGEIIVNLSEHVNQKPNSRRYLMQNAKINSTLRLTILMKQIRGETNYIVPTLKLGQIYGGITDLVAERKEIEEHRLNPNLNTEDFSRNKISERLYRNTLVASFYRESGALPPTDAIEDIFRGSSGFNGTDSDALPDISEIEKYTKYFPNEIKEISARENLRSWKVGINRDKKMEALKTLLAGLPADDPKVIELTR